MCAIPRSEDEEGKGRWLGRRMAVVVGGGDGRLGSGALLCWR